MDKHHEKQAARRPKTRKYSCSEEVTSVKWEFINMSEEEDIVNRMYRLVGDRDAIELFLSKQANILGCLLKWDLIAGRIPGRKPEEIERFWIMKHGQAFTEKNNSAFFKKVLIHS